MDLALVLSGAGGAPLLRFLGAFDLLAVATVNKAVRREIGSKKASFWMNLYREAAAAAADFRVSTLDEYIEATQTLFLRLLDADTFASIVVHPFSRYRDLFAELAPGVYDAGSAMSVYQGGRRRLVLVGPGDYIGRVAVPGDILRDCVDVVNRHRPELNVLVCTRGSFQFPRNRLVSFALDPFRDTIHPIIAEDAFSARFPAIVRYLHSGRPWYLFRTWQRFFKPRCPICCRDLYRDLSYPGGGDGMAPIFAQLERCLRYLYEVDDVPEIVDNDGRLYPRLFWNVTRVRDHQICVFWARDRFWLRLNALPRNLPGRWSFPIAPFPSLTEIFTELDQLEFGPQ